MPALPVFFDRRPFLSLFKMTATKRMAIEPKNKKGSSCGGRKEKGHKRTAKRANFFAVLCETLCALCVNCILERKLTN